MWGTQFIEVITSVDSQARIERLNVRFAGTVQEFLQLDFAGNDYVPHPFYGASFQVPGIGVLRLH